MVHLVSQNNLKVGEKRTCRNEVFFWILGLSADAPPTKALMLDKAVHHFLHFHVPKAQVAGL